MGSFHPFLAFNFDRKIGKFFPYYHHQRMNLPCLYLQVFNVPRFSYLKKIYILIASIQNLFHGIHANAVTVYQRQRKAERDQCICPKDLLYSERLKRSVKNGTQSLTQWVYKIICNVETRSIATYICMYSKGIFDFVSVQNHPQFFKIFPEKLKFIK